MNRNGVRPFQMAHGDSGRIPSPYRTELFGVWQNAQGTDAAVHPVLPDIHLPCCRIDSMVVQVQKSESEADDEETAERVGKRIMAKAARSVAVGGIR